MVGPYLAHSQTRAASSAWGGVCSISGEVQESNWIISVENR